LPQLRLGVLIVKTYVAKCGKPQLKQALSTLLRAAQDDDNTGFCLACGSEQTGVEPDARRVPCEVCGEPKVYGAEELLLRKLYYDDPPAEGRYVSDVIRTSGGVFYRNKRGRCEDAPCCGCCTI
jgi:hypothetical protein